jgi:hypothetical protein
VARIFKRFSDEDKERALRMARAGATVEDIAAQLKVRVKRLRKVFRRQLREADAEGKQEALEKLRDVALSGNNISALTFWVKARCGWRDTGPAVSGASTASHPFVVTVSPDAPNA